MVRFDLKFVALLIFVTKFDITQSRRYSRGYLSSDGYRGYNFCETKHELMSCKYDCYNDRECNDESNLNCDRKCKQACLRLERLGRCRAALLTELLMVRGRLDDDDDDDDYDGPYRRTRYGYSGRRYGRRYHGGHHRRSRHRRYGRDRDWGGYSGSYRYGRRHGRGSGRGRHGGFDDGDDFDDGDRGGDRGGRDRGSNSRGQSSSKVVNNPTDVKGVTGGKNVVNTKLV